jgi:hypothetical protein
MDLLDRVQPAARGLLDRVDGTLLASGAPDGHRIWPLLRRVGALPGEVVDQFAAVAPAALTAAAAPLHGRAEAYSSAAASVPAVSAWRGPAAEGFVAGWAALGAHLAGDEDTMAGRLLDSARFLDDVAGWLARGRRELAGALAECLGSAEAATLHGLPPPGPATPHEPAPGAATGREAVAAAAGIGAHLLAAVADIIDDGQRTLDVWAGRLDELPYRGATPPGVGITGRLEIG